MRNVSVSVHNFTRPSLRDRCWKGRVEGKITSIAFFHAWFGNFSLPFQLYRLLSLYNALVNPHFDYYSGMGIFLRVARPQEYEYFETYDIILHQSAFWSEPADQKSFLFKPRWFKFRSRGMRVRMKNAISTVRDSYGLGLRALSSKFEESCHALHNISKVVLRETRPPTPSYYSNYNVWLKTWLYACLSTSLYRWL